MKKKLLIYLFLGYLVLACEKPRIVDLPQPTVLVSSAYLRLNTSIIEVNCESINPARVNKEEFGIVWAEKPSPTVKDNFQYAGNNSTNDGPFTQQIRNVKTGIRYYIRGYIKIGENYIYSPDYIYEPFLPLGWDRVDDIPRDGNINVEFAVAKSGDKAVFYTKELGAEILQPYGYFPYNNFWAKDRNTQDVVYDKFNFDLQYAADKMAYIYGGGYVRNPYAAQEKKYVRTVDTEIGQLVDFPGELGPTVGFGASNRGFVIEAKKNPSMYAYDYESFDWQKMKDPPFTSFYKLKAARTKTGALILLESNPLEKQGIKVYAYTPKSDSWEQLPNFPADDRNEGTAFEINGRTFYGLGISKTTGAGIKDIWEFQAATKTWKKYGEYPGAGNISLAKVKINNFLCFGLGYGASPTQIGTYRQFQAYDMWIFKPQ
jgi:hypothetical protein